VKCPKCGYLGFEAVDRCRNCGFEFSLAQPVNLPELAIRDDSAEIPQLDDLTLVNAASPEDSPEGVTEFAPEIERLLGSRPREPMSELTLFGEDDASLTRKPRPPRPPLAVRRATQDVPRLRSTEPRAAMLDLAPPDAGAHASTSLTPRSEGDAGSGIAGQPPAAVGARVAAVALDLLLLALIDAVVIYFTAEICGLDLAEVGVLPKGPLLAFLLVQNGGYLVAFTAGGQTLGKMAAGIKVVSTRSNASLDLGHAIVRTVVWALLAAPAGLGFLTAIFSADHRGLHDRCAGTRVVRASA
jgi:uncharacterized RDD family membrane protein YckC